MAVRIRMKQMGRKHRPYYRICAIDGRSPRDGRVLEELGTYDPMVPETDARATLNGERIQYWVGVGAKPSEQVAVLIKKYGPNGTHLEAQREAIERLAQVRRRPDPVKVAAKTPKAKKAEEAGDAPKSDSAQIRAEAAAAADKE